MAELPTTTTTTTTNSNETPLLIPSDIATTQEPIEPDLNNPYAYAGNPVQTTQSEPKDIPLNGKDIAATFNNSSGSLDPELLKLNSAVWRRAGQLQSAIGSLAGLESWQTSGEQKKEHAEREHKEAQNRLQQGEASRLHGEYERLMGYVTYAIGHVAGDPEMQSKASERTDNGTAEIDKSRGRH